MKRFNRRREDFVCSNCGALVEGNGYTNHCPHCLYSKHVDITPGDRAEDCHGMMAPIAVSIERGGYVITHKCSKCGAIKRNKACENDNFEALLQIARLQTEELKSLTRK